MMAEKCIKLSFAIGNYGVAVLNLLDALVTNAPKDWLAALVWAGPGTYWLWQALRRDEPWQ